MRFARVLGWLCLLTLSLYAAAEAVRPTDDRQVLETLPRRDNDPLNASIVQIHAAYAAKPNDLALALSLAHKHLERFRRDADPRDLGQAEAVVSPWLKTATPPIDVLIVRASVRQSNHLFESAIADLNEVLRRQSDSAQALLTEASIFQVQANYALARERCGAMIMQDPVIASLCLGNVAVVDHQIQQGQALVQRGVDGMPTSGSLFLWAMASKGELAAWLGHSEEAEQAFRAGLRVDPRDAYLKSDLADLLLDLGRPKEVLTLLSSDMRNDNLMLRIALAEKQAGGSSRLAEHIDDLKARFAASAERGDRVHQREEARFTLELLNEPENALKLAEANWQVQKEVADCRILLEAAVAARQPQRAAPALHWLKQSGLPDPRLQALQGKLAWADGLIVRRLA